MHLSDTHLIICSPNQCYIYALNALNTPIIVDIKESPVHVQQCERYFALVDSSGVSIYNHDGRSLPPPKIAAMRPDLLDKRFISLSDDVICVVDHADLKCCRFYDVATGKLQDLTVKHSQDIASLSLNVGGGARRKLALVDRNGDAFLCSLGLGFKKGSLVKLAGNFICSWSVFILPAFTALCRHVQLLGLVEHKRHVSRCD
jgi:hypothetical protein